MSIPNREGYESSLDADPSANRNDWSRTSGLVIPNHALFHLSYIPKKCPTRDYSPSLMGKILSSRFQGSNLGPSACKADALPAELNRDRSRQRGSNPHSLRWQRSAIADFAMPAYGRRKCLFLSPLFNFCSPVLLICRHR